MASQFANSPHIFSTMEAAELAKDAVGQIELFGLIERVLPRRAANVQQLNPAKPDDEATPIAQRRLCSTLINRAQYDYHAAAKLHLYYCFFAEDQAVRAYHTDKDRAFEVYSLLANRLAYSSARRDVENWLKYVSSTDQPSSTQQRRAAVVEPPCSGVVNFQLSAELSRILKELADEQLVSMNRLVENILKARLPEVRKSIRKLGTSGCKDALQVSVAKTDFRNHTIRIDRHLHAGIVALASELETSTTAVCTAIVYKALIDR